MTVTHWPPAGLGTATPPSGKTIGGLAPTFSLNEPGEGRDIAPWVLLPQGPSTATHLLQEYTRWVDLPRAVKHTPSSLPRLISQLREWTGWSQRDLASVLGTSHTTVRKLEIDGRVTARSRDAAARIVPVHRVISRIAVTAGHNPSRVAAALNTPGNAGRRPFDLLAEGEYAAAYLAALQALRGSRPGMLAPTSNRTILDATAELP